VLAFDPDNAAVTTALARLEGRRRFRQVLGGLVLAAVVVAGGSAAFRHRKPAAPPLVSSGAAPRRAAPPAAPLATPAATPAISEPGPSLPVKRALAVVHPTHAHEDGRLAAAAAARLATAPGQTRTFALGPTPQNVDVYLDGQRQFAYAPDHTTIAVPWNGDHVLELRSPSGCCFVERVDIGPDHPLPPDAIIARRLKWRPAHLLVTTEPAVGSARVLVSDPNRKVAVSAGRPGEEIDVPFFTDDDSSKEIDVAVDAGDAFATEKIRVRAGQRVTHVVKLKTGASPE
jgi:hypothetical protein